MNLSEKFEKERGKINSQISDEQSIAHCHITINKIEDGVKDFIKKLKHSFSQWECSKSKKEEKEYIDNAIDEHAGEKLIE